MIKHSVLSREMVCFETKNFENTEHLAMDQNVIVNSVTHKEAEPEAIVELCSKFVVCLSY